MSKFLGNNIRILRLAYGETQEQLGEVINFGKNTISYFESGKRVPSNETLQAIAKHYMVTVEELLNYDLSPIGKISVDDSNFWKSIPYLLPIIASKKALKNDIFKKAYEMHQTLYNQLQQMDDVEALDTISACIESYSYAMVKKDCSVEASANCLAIMYLVKVVYKSMLLLDKNPTTGLVHLLSEDEDIRKWLNDPDSSPISEANEFFKEFNNDEMKNEILETLATIKSSEKYSDLAYYYLALQYIWDLVDNGLDWSYNLIIGYEMLYTFSSIKNVYATRYLRFVFNSTKGNLQSSQSGNDKS